MARQAVGMSGFDFTNAMVVVTGAGIGQGIAQAFHAAGARVALGDLRKDAVERTATGLGGGGSSPALSTCGREKSGQAFFAAAERALGPVTVAVAQRRHLSELPGSRHGRRRMGRRDRDQHARAKKGGGAHV